MSAPAGETLRELERELLIASEQGETRAFGDLQGQLGVGHGQLEEALDTLREHGKAVEAAPGEWRGPMADELGEGPVNGSQPEAEEPRVEVHVGGEDEPGAISAVDGSRVEFYPPPADQPTVRLTFAIADALEPASLGALVKAGISEAKEHGEPFWLEVV